MSIYVVDASVVMANFLAEPETPYAQALFRDFMVNQNHSLILPEFGKLECANVIWKHVRLYGLAQSQGELLIRELIQYPFRLFSVEGLYEVTYRAGLQYQLALYDTVYIVLAKHLNYPLITIDQKQAAAARSEGVTLKPVTDFSPQV